MGTDEKIILAITLGDQAGIGQEIAAKSLSKGHEGFIPLLIGSYRLFCESGAALKVELTDCSDRSALGDGVYFYDIPAGTDIHAGEVSADSGRLIYDSLAAAVALEQRGFADGVIMGPITKQALHLSGAGYSSEFEIFAKLYSAPSVSAVIKCENIFRATVVGHCAFSEIVSRLTQQGIERTALNLIDVIKAFRGDEGRGIAVAALNPHAGEDGLFGDEEARIIAPAVAHLRELGHIVEGPCPADTVFLRAVNGQNEGVVFLYHDQGNIAMKSRFFGGGVLIYRTGTPAVICSVGHGSALDIAGQGIADEMNTDACIATAVTLCKNGKAQTQK